MSKSIFNLNQNVAAALSYLLGPVTGLIFYIGETSTGNNNKFVKFHALQSTIYFGILCVVRIIFNILRFLPFMRLINWILEIVMLVSMVYLIYVAYKGKTFKIPVIGDTCWNQVDK